MTDIVNLLAEADPIGVIEPPVSTMPRLVNGDLTPIINFLNGILRLVFAVAGLYVFINFIIAGFTYLSAGGDSKKLDQAWSRIWQSLLGLVIIVCSFLVAAIIGIIFFNDPSVILNPKITP
jgi:hypothetical protein